MNNLAYKDEFSRGTTLLLPHLAMRHLVTYPTIGLDDWSDIASVLFRESLSGRKPLHCELA
ncbi:MAG: hypothetical protein RI911_658 [Candidatus Parcubacteria bacterium]|jgi:hypothetical protein